MSDSLDHYWKRIKNGDERTFEKLFKEFYAPLCYYSRQITHDNFLSEEIVQDVFHKIWQDREITTIHSSFKSYVYQSVRNLSINEFKKKSTLKSSVNKTASDEIWKYLIDNTESNDFIIEKITSTDTARTIDHAIGALPSQCRLVFQLSRIENKSNEEVAVQLDISVNTVRAHIYTALSKISALLREEK
jgi:RNA polymerase sigma-70 factor, ECF subfamily